MKPFNCTSCGACCRAVPDATLSLHGLPKHPTQSGCGHLKADNTCGIYEKRPLVCRVDGMFKEHYMQTGLTWDEFCADNEKVCKQLQENECQSPKDTPSPAS